MVSGPNYIPSQKIHLFVIGAEIRRTRYHELRSDIRGIEAEHTPDMFPIHGIRPDS